MKMTGGRVGRSNIHGLAAEGGRLAVYRFGDVEELSSGSLGRRWIAGIELKREKQRERSHQIVAKANLLGTCLNDGSLQADGFTNGIKSGGIFAEAALHSREGIFGIGCEKLLANGRGLLIGIDGFTGAAQIEAFAIAKCVANQEMQYERAANDLQEDLEMDLTRGSRLCVGRTVSDC